MTGKFVALLVTLLITGSASGSAKAPPREVFGIRIGMREEMVHKQLRKIATRQEEERENEKESEQEVWLLQRNDRFEYLLTRFNRGKRLTLITVVARPDRVRYSDVGSTSHAIFASDGRNFSYKWRTPKKGERQAELVIARGSNQEYLTSYSLYPAK